MKLNAINTSPEISCNAELKQYISQLRFVPSVVLLGDKKSITILHEGESYLLRLTKLGKLVLTK